MKGVDSVEFIIENWMIIVAGIAALIGAVVFAVDFFKANREKQIENVKEWLLYAVTLAEKELGSGTGKLKLRQVYDMFTARFPWLAKIITFNKFSEMVDEALVTMNELLDTNAAINEYVDGDNTELKG